MLAITLLLSWCILGVAIVVRRVTRARSNYRAAKASGFPVFYSPYVMGIALVIEWNSADIFQNFAH
jgi:hypothetical protein